MPFAFGPFSIPQPSFGVIKDAAGNPVKVVRHKPGTLANEVIHPGADGITYDGATPNQNAQYFFVDPADPKYQVMSDSPDAVRAELKIAKGNAVRAVQLHFVGAMSPFSCQQPVVSLNFLIPDGGPQKALKTDESGAMVWADLTQDDISLIKSQTLRDLKTVIVDLENPGQLISYIGSVMRLPFEEA